MSELSQRDQSILEAIIRNCESIAERLAKYGIGATVFAENDDYREMVLFPLIQIGELANHLSPSFTEEHDDVPWSDVVGMRHIIVHGYDTIDVSWAWSTISNDVEPLAAACSDMLSKSESGND